MGWILVRLFFLYIIFHADSIHMQYAYTYIIERKTSFISI